jgi:hypothetical protein
VAAPIRRIRVRRTILPSLQEEDAMDAFGIAITMIFVVGVAAVAVFALYRILTAAHRDRLHPRH